MCIRLYLEQPFCSRYSYTFVLTNGTAGSADYTTTDVVTVLLCNYWNGIGTNNCGYNWWSGRNFSIANGTASATGTIIDNNAPTVATITLLGYRRIWCGIDLHWANPSAVDTSCILLF
jgi:hypothetical protein